MIYYSHDITITITIAASGRYLRTEWAFITLRVARCTLHARARAGAGQQCPVLRVHAPCTMFQASRRQHVSPCMTWAAARRNAAASRWGRGKERHHLWNRSVIQTSGSGFHSGSGSGSGRGSSTQESDPSGTLRHARAQAARRGREDSSRVWTLLLGVWVRCESKKKKKKRMAQCGLRMGRKTRLAGIPAFVDLTR